MQGIMLVQLAAIVAAFSNALLKQCSVCTSRQGILFLFFFGSLLAVLLQAPQFSYTTFSAPIFALGGVISVLLYLLFSSVTKALACGPMGLTFAFQNAGALLTPILLFLVFGPSYSFILTSKHIIGMILVLGGLFWSAKDEVKKISSSWLGYALLALLFQGIVLSLYQYRYLIYTTEAIPPHPLIFFKSPIEADVWLMPGMYVVASIITGMRHMKEAEALHKNIVFYGLSAGFLNGVVSLLLLVSIWYCSTATKAFLFPSFAASVMIACALVGRIAFKEKIIWSGIILAAAGVFVGTL